MRTITTLLLFLFCSQSYGSNSTLSNYRFDSITPTGELIFESSLEWFENQIDELSYPQPSMCAANVSRVLSDAGLDDYWSDSVIGLVDNIENNGGKVFYLPRDHQGIIDAINTIFDGRIPAGSIVVGCLNQDCSGKPGDGHASIVGDLDSEGNTQLYHNNWYRPDNNGGVWVEHMISRYHYYELGLLRQWMPTPWLFIERENNIVSDISSSLPAIDDLDPYQYYLRVAIPAEILNEIIEAKETDGNGNIKYLYQ